MTTGDSKPHPTYVVAFGCTVAVTVVVDLLVLPGMVLVVVLVTVDVEQRTVLAKSCATSSGTLKPSAASSRFLIAPPEPEFDEPGRLLWIGINLIQRLASQNCPGSLVFDCRLTLGIVWM